jgi:class 3 adenylate cyclase
MQEIADWLQKLGMSEYAPRFAENRIDFSVLPDLTDQDLKDLGVVLGDRRKILRAIAGLKSTETVAPSPATEAVIARSQDAAERRQVTVMFSDLVGSTALSARMDPEDLREVISAYQKCVAETVQRFGGFVAKYMGDGVLVYFGYPQAHEDDAERAVRAGMELVAAVGALKTHSPLQTRLGIATGLVIVGDLIDSGASQEQVIVGETPNLAARLQGVAEPNAVVVAESTRRLLGNLFELENLGAQDLKGIAGPVRAWAALRPSFIENRFEALHASGLTELVGREEELELLLRRWSKAKTGEGQVVLLSGEPGIGKSRPIAHADVGQFDAAWRCVREAITMIETAKERLWEAEVNRVAGEIALMSPQQDTSKAEAYFERALAVARQQQAKSWELRAAMSLARLWRDQGKVQQARELLAPVYGWFTEGFDTRDLKEAKALLESLAAA